ncbi:MAG TPA: hypothetical protein VFU15_14905, partial [Bacteroidia bacterium]|nr:hypothetical protein [Bacteroidia bacterium]
MSRKILTAIASVVVAVMIAIPFIAPRGKTEVQATKVDPAFGAYISAYTSGIISDESYIRITLASEYTGPVTLDKPADEDYFSFDPGIPGKTYWLDTRTLEFRPDARLASDKVYNCEFRLGKLITDIPEQFRTMKFSFRTMKQGFNVSVDGMKTTDRKTMRWQQMSGTLTTNDAADPKIVEQMLAVAQDNHALHVKWIHEGDNVTHHFTVDSIARRDREGKVTLTTDGKALGVEQKNSSDIKIPSLKDFKVTDVRLEQGEEQSVVVEFSDPLQEKQNLDGLVTLKGVDNLRFSIEDNDVRIFPPSQLSGDYTLTVTHGVKNILGFSLPNSFTQVMTFEELKPQVKLVGKGVILPNSKAGLLFPFQAVSLKAVDVKIIRIYENNIPQFLQVNSLDGSSELYRVGKVVVKKKVDLNIKSKADYSKWTSFSLDLGEMIKAEPGAIYRVSIGFRKSYAVYNCAGDTTTNSTIANDDEDNSFSGGDDDEDDDNGYGYYGGDYYDDEYYYYDDGDRADPCDDSYY